LESQLAVRRIDGVQVRDLAVRKAHSDAWTNALDRDTMIKAFHWDPNERGR